MFPPGPPKAGKRSAKGRTNPAPATSPQTSSSSSPSGSPSGDHDPRESASDSKEDNRKTQRPKPFWQDDVRNGHKEDILCIAQCPPRHLATGSYDGEIIVWSVVSERILCRFHIVQPTPPQPSSSFSVVHPTSVLSLMFLKTQAFVPELSSAACLLTSDCKGQVHFWSVLNRGNFSTSFQASQQAIKKLALTSDDSVLFASDFAGFIY